MLVLILQVLPSQLQLLYVLPFEEVFDRLSKRFWERDVDIFGLEVFVPGVRITLWLAALIMLGAGLIAIISLRSGKETEDS